eukprot:3512279-Pyramimonas_sp.AAC.1
MTRRGARARSAGPLQQQPRNEEARVPGRRSMPTAPSLAGARGCGRRPSDFDRIGSGATIRMGAYALPIPTGDTSRHPAKSTLSWSDGTASLLKTQGGPRSSSRTG